MSSNAREYDLVLFGATGFTGSLTAEYLAAHWKESRGEESSTPRWAIAGRNAEKLTTLAKRLGERNGSEPGTMVAELDDPASLRALCERTRVLVSTVGPYQRWGLPVVEAAVAGGCDYLDITGEPEFVDTVIRRWDDAARERGLRLVSCCGFDSIPHDYGAWLAARALPADQSITVEGFVRGVGTFSGGTWQSAVEAMGRMGQWRPRFPKAEDGRQVRLRRPRVGRDARVGSWVAPLPTIDPFVVLRSAARLPEYGPEFYYSHLVRVRSLGSLVTRGAGLAAIAGLAKLPPTRKMLLGVRGSGEGPSAEQRARSHFECIFLGKAGRLTSKAIVSGGDPGYGETSKMLAESALSLVCDRERLPQRAGALTPVTAFGEVLLERLRRAGMRLETVEGLDS